MRIMVRAVAAALSVLVLGDLAGAL